MCVRGRLRQEEGPPERERENWGREISSCVGGRSVCQREVTSERGRERKKREGEGEKDRDRDNSHSRRGGGATYGERKLSLPERERDK